VNFFAMGLQIIHLPLGLPEAAAFFYLIMNTF